MNNRLLLLSVSTSLAWLGLIGCKKEQDTLPEPLAPVSAEPPAANVAPPAEPPVAQTAAPSPEPAASASAAPANPASQPAAAKSKPSTPASASAPTSTASAPAADAGPAGRLTTPNPGLQSIQRCCSALSAAAQKGGRTQSQYKSAASICQGIAAAVKKGTANAEAARTSIRAQLHGVPVPPEC